MKTETQLCCIFLTMVRKYMIFVINMDGTDLASDTHQALKPQLDIPFMIYFTPTYAGLHPYLVKGIKAALNKRFMSDDMAQVVCDILGVKSRFFRKSRSLINYDYSEPKHRILQNHVIYD